MAATSPSHFMNVHPTAIIDSRAKVHPSCKVGPYCVIGPDVQLGEGCHLVSHVAIEGPTTIGVGNGFFPFSAIGMAFMIPCTSSIPPAVRRTISQDSPAACS